MRTRTEPQEIKVLAFKKDNVNKDYNTWVLKEAFKKAKSEPVIVFYAFGDKTAWDKALRTVIKTENNRDFLIGWIYKEKFVPSTLTGYLLDL
jgi:hypothetical protein